MGHHIPLPRFIVRKLSATMTTQEALEIVSYKMALKDPVAAKADPVLIPSIIEKALADQAAGSPKNRPKGLHGCYEARQTTPSRPR
ncbi:hypothetical protein [Rubritalea tangerina]|uniref:hypothetical protein n=1 Tax=Rubritalea tangerina TaxID=430798 RepID=UPI00360CE369